MGDLFMNAHNRIRFYYLLPCETPCNCLKHILFFLRRFHFYYQHILNLKKMLKNVVKLFCLLTKKKNVMYCFFLLLTQPKNDIRKYIYHCELV